jgi:hypothetical protein
MTNTKVLSLSIYNPVSITTGILATGTTGTPYNQTLAAVGGKTPYTWSISAGTLPSGLSLNNVTGVISGTPTSAGTSTVTFRVTDANNGTNTKALAITINSTFYITTSTLAFGTTGTTYSQTLTATGGKTPYTWSLTSGSLPAGLSLNSTTGVISGTPTATGSSTFTVQVKDDNNATATKSFSITIYAAVSITTTALASGTTGSAYNQALAATGGLQPYMWSTVLTAATTSLPAGLSLNSSTGIISGTPTSAGTSTVTFRVTDANNGMSNKLLGITIYGPLGITTSSLPTGTTGTAYSQTLAATGGKTPYNWSITTGILPTGLSLAGSTGVISGTPTTTGTSTFSVQVKDANNTTSTKTLSISIYAPLTIGTSTLPAATRGVAYSQTLTATGGKTPYAWSISSGNLPAGLTLNSSTGVISGTPTTKGTSSFTVKVTDANAIAATKSLSITVN